MSEAAAAPKSLRSCPTLCDPIDSSPPGSPVPGILQARTLQWVAISFCNAWKWKVKVKSLSSVQLFATPWTVAYQAPLSMGFSGRSTGVGCHCLSTLTLCCMKKSLLRKLEVKEMKGVYVYKQNLSEQKIYLGKHHWLLWRKICCSGNLSLLVWEVKWALKNKSRKWSICAVLSGQHGWEARASHVGGRGNVAQGSLFPS